MDLPEAAAHVLCRAYKSRDGSGYGGLYLIDRTLGYKTWATKGALGRHDIAPLYRQGLVKEWFTPWGPPLFLTEKGATARKELRRKMGYD